jgi:5-methylcytosine-specific restriction enzyme subunit McrC
LAHGLHLVSGLRCGLAPRAAGHPVETRARGALGARAHWMSAERLVYVAPVPACRLRVFCRDVDNDVSRVLVAAEHVLSHHIGHSEWRSPRVDELLPQLHAAVGVRPRLPSKRALERIRYSPITRLFNAAAALSWRLAQLEGFIASSEEGEAEGLLLDVAELWELYVLNCTRDAVPQLTVEHWAEDADDAWLLRSRDHDGRGLGRLRPDVLILKHSRPVAVLDAKYKRLADWWPERPQGVDRGDLYQLATYISRFGSEPSVMGALIYPRDPDQGPAEPGQFRGVRPVDDGFRQQDVLRASCPRGRGGGR